MTRQLTITAAEWASVTDGTLWLVREGDDCACSSDGGTWAGGGGFALSCPICHDADSVPPAEFMQTSAPCVPSAPWHERAHAGCNYLPGHFSGGALYCNKCGWAAPCPDCRIELVGPCPDCGGDGWTAEHDSSCDGYERCYALGCPVQVQCASCQFTGIATLGHAYAVGEPLPIAWGVCDLSVPFVGVWRPPYPPTVLFLDPDEDGTPIDLAHYGPSEWLVGKWAIRLEVVGS